MNSHFFNSPILFQSPVAFNGMGPEAVDDPVSEPMATRLRQPNAKNVVIGTLRVGEWATVIAISSYASGIHGFRTTKVADAVKMRGAGFLTEAPSFVGLTDYSFFASATALHGSAGTQPIQTKPAYLYVKLPTSVTLEDLTLEAYYDFRFATTPKELRGFYWEPRIVSLPRLSIRIESKFGGVGQLGGGRLVLNNGDGFFDDLDDLDWDSATMALELGLDHPSADDMDEADYRPIGTWKCTVTERNNQTLSLQLQELKTRLENKIPYETFGRENYPFLDQADFGKVIPFAYGKLFGVKPLLVSAESKQFKVAGHRIRRFDAVRVRSSGGGWVESAFASVDLAKAEFTLGDDWDSGTDVSVDFSGRVNPDLTLMTNAADIVADLLQYVGETSFHQGSFDESRRLLRIGEDRFGQELSVLAPSIYIDTAKTALEVVGSINALVGSSLYVDFEGKWRYIVFDPTQEINLRVAPTRTPRAFSSEEIIDGTFQRSIDRTRVFSKVRVNYAERKQDDFRESVVEENRVTRHRHVINALQVEERTVGLSSRNDAIYYAQRLLVTEALPATTFKFDLPRNGYFLLPGQMIHIERERDGMDSILEVLSVDLDLTGNRVTLTCGNQRGWDDTFGFWSPDIGTGEVQPEFPPDYIFWLKSDLLTYAPGQRVPRFSDFSRYQNHFEQALPSAQPIMMGQINGHNAIQFRGSGGVGDVFLTLTLPISRLPAPLTAGEIFLILKRNLPDGDGAWGTFGPASAGVASHPDLVGDINETFGTNAIFNVTPSLDVFDWHLYNVSSKSGELTVRVSGQVMDQRLVNTVTWNTSGSNYVFRLGANTTFFAYYSGWIVEPLMYPRVLTAAEREVVVKYYSDKFALELDPSGGGGSASPVTPPDPWDPSWTTSEVWERRENFGYWTAKYNNGLPHSSTNPELDMADVLDPRSFWSSRWW